MAPFTIAVYAYVLFIIALQQHGHVRGAVRQ